MGTNGKMQVIHKVHPLGCVLPKWVGKVRYTIKINRSEISLVKFYDGFKWGWELLGGKIRIPIRFPTKYGAISYIKSIYKI